MDFKNWRHLHPNSSGCVLLDSSESYLSEWVSADCNSKQTGFLCAKSPSSIGLPTPLPPLTINQNSKCDDGWIERPFSNYCYKIDLRLLSYDQANSNCNTFNASNLLSSFS